MPVIFAIAILFMCFPLRAEKMEPLPDLVIGSKDAPVTLIEYSSLNCGHCAEFHTKVFPNIMKEYVNTGKVKVVFRHFPLDGPALVLSSIFSQVPAKDQARILSKIFGKQEEWIRDETFKKFAAICGVDPKKIPEIQKDEKLHKRLLVASIHGQKKYKIGGTPFFVINGEKLEGLNVFPTFKKIINKFISVS